MSMISAQIDELRQMADGQATYRDAREVMLRAADTIWELRESVYRERAEADKLRELLDYMTPIAWYAASERERDRMRKLGIEVGDA